MKGPSLQKTAALSTVLHVTVVLLAVVMTRQAARMTLPSPYIVDLIGPVSEPRQSRGRDVSVAAPAEQTEQTETPPDKGDEKKMKEERIDEDRVDNAIAALEAKKKIASLSRLKKRMLEIKSGKPKAATQKTAHGKPSSRNSTGHSKALYSTGRYEDKIISEIWKQWYYPGTADKNLETIINVMIQKDGTISVQDFEKKSGNRLFDSSALKAIAMASPVTPPPHEYEMTKIGIKFAP